MPIMQASWTLFWMNPLHLICIGVSGGSGNLASYLAGQKGRNLRFFTEHIHSPDYFGFKSLFKTGDLFGLQYIYGELTRAGGKDPLDFPAFMRNPTEYEAVVTNAFDRKTGILWARHDETR